MGLQDKANSILTIKGQIKTAIEGKKGSSVTGAFSTYPTEITNLPTGGGGSGNVVSSRITLDNMGTLTTNVEAATWIIVPDTETWTVPYNTWVYGATVADGGFVNTTYGSFFGEFHVNTGGTFTCNGDALSPSIDGLLEKTSATTGLRVGIANATVYAGGTLACHAEGGVTNPIVSNGGLLQMEKGYCGNANVLSGGTIYVDVNARASVIANASATVEGGGTITYLVDTTDTDADVGNVLTGKTFYSANGRYSKSGTMAYSQVTSGSTACSLTAGYYAGGTVCTYIDPTTADATESDVLSGKKFYASNNTLKTGTASNVGMPTMPTSWSTISGTFFTATSDGFLRFSVNLSEHSGSVSAQISVNGGNDVTLVYIQQPDAEPYNANILGYYPLHSGDTVAISGVNYSLVTFSFGAI